MIASNLAEIRHRELDLGGVRLHVAEQGEGPLVVLLHGFPESWYSWRRQMPALAAAGYRVVAPDQRGYGESDRPAAVEDYDVVALSGDVAGLIQALGEDQAVVVGHDWGASVAWHTALMHPGRVRGVVGLSVPFAGRPKGSPLARMRQLFDGSFFYMLYFQEPGVAEVELEADIRRTLRMFYYSISGEAAGKAMQPAPPDSKFLDTLLDCETLPEWLGEQDLDYYVSRFERSGFRGPLNWYRNFDRSWERTAPFAGRAIEAPALFIGGSVDPVVLIARGQLERMPRAVPNLQKTLMLEGAGHWIQQERATEVNAALLEFLGGLG
jgi:pimeloyl-ACP methyl ester carboxylesterase